MPNDNLSEMIDFDPLAAAEEITGLSYKEDESTAGLGFAMHIEHTRNKRALLQEFDETYWSMPAEELLRVAQEEGFELILEEKFEHDSTGGVTEYHRFLLHPDGILMITDTYRGKVNQVTLYFNWKRHQETGWPERCSGHFTPSPDNPEELVWVGDWRAFDRMRGWLADMRKGGDFLPAWIEQPHLSLLHWAEDRDLDRDDRCSAEAEKYAALPERIREVTGLRLERG